MNLELLLQLHNSVRIRQVLVSRPLKVLMKPETFNDPEDAVADAQRESERAGDVYYKTITKWTVSRFTNGSGRKCYELAMAYDHAIDRLIDRLKHQLISAASRRKIIKLAVEQKSLLKADLDYFGTNLPPFPNEQKENAEPSASNEDGNRIAQTA